MVELAVGIFLQLKLGSQITAIFISQILLSSHNFIID